MLVTSSECTGTTSPFLLQLSVNITTDDSGSKLVAPCCLQLPSLSIVLSGLGSPYTAVITQYL